MENNIEVKENQEYEDISNKIDDLYKEIDKLRAEQHKVSADLINLKGKFLAIKDSVYGDTYSKYAYCYDCWYTSDMNNYPAWCLNCVCFSGHITDYLDDSYMKYDQLEQIYLYNTVDNPVQRDIKRFTIITKEEYMSKFNELIDQVKEEHNKLNFEKLIED